MKILGRITYALFIATLYLFVFFELDRIENNKYFNKYGKDATLKKDYSFFLKGMGIYKNEPIYEIEDSECFLLFFEVYRFERAQGEDRNHFRNENVVIFLVPKDNIKIDDKNYYYLLLGDNNEVLREPLVLNNYKDLGIYLFTFPRTGNITIPKEYFINDFYKNNEETIKPFTKLYFVKNDNQNIRDYENNIKELEHIFTKDINPKDFLEQFTISKDFQEIKKEVGNNPKKALEVLLERKKDISPMQTPKIDMFNPILSFTLFYLSGTILLTYFIFFFPRLLKDYKLREYNLRKRAREREFKKIENENQNK